MGGYLVLALLFVLLVGAVGGLALRLQGSRPEGRARLTSHGRVLRTVRRRSLAYWRRSV